MGVREDLVKTAKENRTILCFGVDPDINRIDVGGMNVGSNGIVPYFQEIIDKLLDEHAIAAIKPNYAFFAQYGFEGLYCLESIIQRYQGKVPVILDAKRGDIGKTGQAYAKEIYELWRADAVTVSPYMGYDSVEPFLREGKLAYILCRTSNKGAADFQELKSGRKQLYEHVAEKALEWKCGAVVGATSDSIKKVVKITKGEVPMLIPGIGAQGGDLELVMKAIKKDPYIHRINASSSIAYAHEKTGDNPAASALAEAEKINKTIRKLGKF